MAALFPRWSNTALRVAILAVVAVLIGTPLALMAWVRSPYVTGQNDPIEQPVQFDHRHHVRDDGIDCRYCHDLVDRSPYAGIPSTETCMGCHNQIWNDSPLLEPVRRSYYENRPIRWRRVNDLPDFVYFNHSIHVNKGVGCVTCHGRVDLMARVYKAEPLTMGWCLGCHREPERHLRPLSQITDMDWKPEVPQRRLGEELKELYAVEELVNCTTCHR